MRFTRYPAKEPYQPDKARRLAAAKKHIEKEKAKVPMFPELVKETVEERVTSLDDANRKWLAEMRQFQAESWCRARRALSSLPVDRRQVLLEEWDSMSYLPGSPEYLLDFLRGKGVKLEKSMLIR